MPHATAVREELRPCLCAGVLITFERHVSRYAFVAIPQISGSPAHMVLQNTRYVFRPVASDADGDTLTFSIRQKPEWATFNPGTGRLSGTPRPADVGTYPNIRISVSDSRTMASLPTFGITVTQSASESVTLSWLPPSTNNDGSRSHRPGGLQDLIWANSIRRARNRVIVLNNAGTQPIRRPRPVASSRGTSR